MGKHTNYNFPSSHKDGQRQFQEILAAKAARTKRRKRALATALVFGFLVLAVYAGYRVLTCQGMEVLCSVNR